MDDRPYGSLRMIETSNSCRLLSLFPDCCHPLYGQPGNQDFCKHAGIPLALSDHLAARGAHFQALTNSRPLYRTPCHETLAFFRRPLRGIAFERTFWRLITMQLFTRGLTFMSLTTSKKVSSFFAARCVYAGARRTRGYAALACTPLLLSIVPATAIAQQQVAGLSATSSVLPDAPVPQDVQSSAGQASQVEGTASVSGIVVDSTGALIAGAQVSLTQRDGRTLHTLVSGAAGEFTFTKLPAGSYLVMVTADGFSPFTSAEFTVSSQQSYVVPDITLSVGGAVTSVMVRPTEVIAAEQIKAEEKQRLLGIVPNFYVSYAHDPAPLTTKQKFSLAAHDSLDWTSFVGISVTAGIEQANNTYAGYGQGAAGYGKRWAAKFGDGRTSDFFGHAVFPSIFHQDPRYFYQGTGTNKSRLMHALEHPFIARGDDGHNMPNYSYLLGDMVSGALSNAYYPHADRGASLVFTNSLVGLAGLAGATVLQEFIGKRLTKNSSKSSAQDPTLLASPRPTQPAGLPQQSSSTGHPNHPQTGPSN
jgi:hypothetical protein